MDNNIPIPTLYVSENLFFLIEDGHILVWNYQLHEQFILEEKYFSEFMHIARHGTSKDEIICNELLMENLITFNPPDNKTWGWDILSRIFHKGTKDVGSNSIGLDEKDYTVAYINQCSSLSAMMPALFIEKDGNLIDLPEPDISQLEQKSFFSVLKERKTCRSFLSKNITLDKLSLMLYCSFGLIHGNEWDELKKLDLVQTGIRKASPSSGGIHPEEIYLIVYRITGLNKGLYHYRPHDHRLTLIKEGDYEDDIINMNYQQYFSKGLAFGIYVTTRPEKIWWKYKHSRAYRTMLLDVGHLSQTFLTSATALNLQTWLTGAFHDSQVEHFLNLADDHETVILFLGAGIGTNQTLPDTCVELLINNTMAAP